MIGEHDLVVLTANLCSGGLAPGDIGTVVGIHRGGEAFEVEFATLDGSTIAVTTLLADQIRPIAPREIAHARALAGI